MFDLVIVGSGPAAISSLLSLKKSKKKICIITGENSNKKNIAVDHPKISFLKKNNNNFGDFFFNKKNKKTFSSNQIGGLSNYWGQGFGFNNFDSLSEKKIFLNKKDYIKIIKKLYDYFNLKNEKFFIFDKKKFNQSKILSGYKDNKNLDLTTFPHLFKYLTKKSKINVEKNKVIKILNGKNYVKLILSNKKEIKTKKVLLSAGVIGNGKIIFNSFENIEKCKFKDDCPNLYYSYILNKKFVEKLSNYISYTLNNKNEFLSIYSLSKIDIKFLLFYFFKIKLNFKKKLYFSFFQNFIFFQQWNKNTIREIILKKNGSFEIKKFKRKRKLNIKIKNILVFKKSETYPGEGFHYHNLRIFYKNKILNIKKFLSLKFGSKVICIDSSISNKIQPGPFTASEMAISYKISECFK